MLNRVTKCSWIDYKVGYITNSNKSSCFLRLLFFMDLEESTVLRQIFSTGLMDLLLSKTLSHSSSLLWLTSSHSLAWLKN